MPQPRATHHGQRPCQQQSHQYVHSRLRQLRRYFCLQMAQAAEPMTTPSCVVLEYRRRRPQAAHEMANSNALVLAWHRLRHERCERPVSATTTTHPLMARRGHGTNEQPYQTNGFGRLFGVRRHLAIQEADLLCKQSLVHRFDVPQRQPHENVSLQFQKCTTARPVFRWQLQYPVPRTKRFAHRERYAPEWPRN